MSSTDGHRARGAGRSLVVLGIDFTSAPRRTKPITVAVGSLVPGRTLAEQAVYRVEVIRELDSFQIFENFLREPGPWVAGFDLPFGQPRPLVQHEGWPDTWPELVAHYCSLPRSGLRDRFRQWCDARPAGHKFAWRKADKSAGSSPAMRWTNPPVAWMMHAGIGRMLAAGLAFPAHAHPPRAGRLRPGAGTARIALEAYPGFTARQVCRDSYKSDAAALQTPARTATRRRILAALVAGTAGLGPRLELSTTWRRKLTADGSGDLIDAAICGLQAAHAALLPGYGLPADLDPLEGWIASVPPPASRAATDSGSETQPPHVPPEACCSTAQSRVSAGSRGSGARSSRGGRDASSAAAASAESGLPPTAVRSTRPVAVRVSISIVSVSPSRSRPIGPPASPSGPTWPMQAPVETPENRASVSRATSRAKGSCLRAPVT